MTLIYQACDGKEFTTEEECLAYEQNYFNKLNEISACWCMYDTDNNLITILQTDEIEEALNDFEEIYNIIKKLTIKKPLSKETIIFLKSYYGIIDTPNEIGEYQYNYHNWEWEKLK